MVSAARVVGNMVRIAGINLGESFFTKEVNQALQMIDGEFGAASIGWELISFRHAPRG